MKVTIDKELNKYDGIDLFPNLTAKAKDTYNALMLNKQQVLDALAKSLEDNFEDIVRDNPIEMKENLLRFIRKF